MEEFPSNSQKARRQERPPPPAEQKKVEKVVRGEVVRRKKPFGRRLAETFLGGDARGAWGHVAMEVLVPRIKDGFIDSFHEVIDHIFDNDREYSRRGRRRHRTGSYVSYDRYSRRDHRDRDEPRSVSRRDRATHNFDEIILPTRVEAEEVIDSLFELVSKFEIATVEDLYELVGITSEYTDKKWGWEDLRGAGVTRVRSGYLLDLPRPEPID